MESLHFLSHKVGLEEGLRASESLRSNVDHLTVREFVGHVLLVGVLEDCINE